MGVVIHYLHVVIVVAGLFVVAHPPPGSLVSRVLCQLQVVDAALVVERHLRAVYHARNGTFDTLLWVLFLIVDVLLQRGRST